jgi:hypothetical protein
MIFYVVVAIVSVHCLPRYMKVSESWPDMACCFVPGASHHHQDDVGCTGTPLWPNNVYIIVGYLLYRKQDDLIFFQSAQYQCRSRREITVLQFEILLSADKLKVCQFSNMSPVVKDAEVTTGKASAQRRPPLALIFVSETCSVYSITIKENWTAIQPVINPSVT